MRVESGQRGIYHTYHNHLMENLVPQSVNVNKRLITVQYQYQTVWNNQKLKCSEDKGVVDFCSYIYGPSVYIKDKLGIYFATDA